MFSNLSQYEFSGIVLKTCLEFKFYFSSWSSQRLASGSPCGFNHLHGNPYTFDRPRILDLLRKQNSDR